MSVEWITETLYKASALRQRAGIDTTLHSHRLLFGEVDGIPGLVIDRYKVRFEHGQSYASADDVMVLQCHSAGADLHLSNITEALHRMIQLERQTLTQSSSNTSSNLWIVLRNDVSSRVPEGLEMRESAELVLTPSVYSSTQAVDMLRRHAYIQVAPAAVISTTIGVLPLRCDLIEGQKTGAFLDQAANIRLATQLFVGSRDWHDTNVKDRPFRILDICCYGGQWSTQLINALSHTHRNTAVEVTLLDSSQVALDIAAQNVRSMATPSLSLSLRTLKQDAKQPLPPDVPAAQFDIVICDPPAFVKSARDLAIGLSAYRKLFSNALRYVRPDGGTVVLCSCSASVSTEHFQHAISGAVRRSQLQSLRWVATGTQSADHPISLDFPQGHYLKALFGVANERRPQ
jgi:23S rRNA (cytosine1962-C5)-methyltransferase